MDSWPQNPACLTRKLDNRSASVPTSWIPCLGPSGHSIIIATLFEHMLNFHAYESSWLCARGPGCHEQYFGSACHWEHFHMLIRINNSCSVICLVFFPSPFLTGGQSGQAMMLPWREGQTICIASSTEGLVGLRLSCWRWGGDWGGLGGNASLSLRESFMPCAGSWGAAGSWSLCKGNVLCCWAFLSHLTFHCNCFKLGALWFPGLCQAWISPLWEAGLAGHKGLSYLG